MSHSIVAIEQIKAAGSKAAAEGRPATANPYLEDTHAHEIWRTSWSEHTALVAA